MRETATLRADAMERGNAFPRSRAYAIWGPPRRGESVRPSWKPVIPSSWAFARDEQVPILTLGE